MSSDEGAEPGPDDPGTLAQPASRTIMRNFASFNGNPCRKVRVRFCHPKAIGRQEALRACVTTS